MDHFVLGIDIGSGSVKLTLLSQEGKVVCNVGCEYPTYYKQAGWAEQDPEDWCKAFRQAFSDLKKTANINAQQIKAISFDAATHTAVLMDENRKIVRRSIFWTDQRSVQEVKELKNMYGDIISTQVLNSPTTVWTLPQLMWIRKHEPETYKKIRYILFAKDYLRFRISGSMETDSIDAMGSMFYDVINERWSDELCEVANVDKKWLPVINDPLDQVGSVDSCAAEEFGLAEGTKIFTGTTDTVMEILASGSIEPGHMTVKLATAGRICVITDHPIVSPFVFNYRHVIKGLWYPGTATSSCAASYRWYRNTIGRQSFSELNKLAEQVPAGCEGMMFHPYLQGELTPYNNPNLRASYTGISTACTTAYFTRATLEGVAFSLRDCMDTICCLGMQGNRVRIIGGGSRGKLWRQIVTDVLNCKMEKIHCDDSSFGTAMLAAVGLGWFKDYSEAVKACIQIDSITYPETENVKIYDELFAKYKRIQKAMEDIYQ